MSGPELTIAGLMTLRRGDAVIDDAAFGGRQLRLVTATLLVDRTDPVSVDRIVHDLWPTGPPDQFRPALRGLVAKVRRLLRDVGVDGDRIRSSHRSYVVDLPELRVDIETAGLALTRARAYLDAGDLVRAQEYGGTARAILSRPLLPGIDADWVDTLRDRAAHDHLDSLLVLAACRHRQGRTNPARKVVREAIDSAPLREDAWRLGMRIEAGAGNPAGALQLYERLRVVLAESLGADPSALTQRLHGRILMDVPDPHTIRVPAGFVDGDDGSWSSRGSGSTFEGNPYVGLRAYRAEDADRFFGRESIVQELVDRLGRHGSVAVVGSSGVGKSSIVQAGLLPALRRGALPDADTWRQVVVTPGHDPLRSLVDALLDGGDRTRGGPDADVIVADLAAEPHKLTALLDRTAGPGTETTLVVIDQAEQLFTLADPDQAQIFVHAVLDAVAPVKRRFFLVLVMRADFYEHAARHPRLAGFLSRSQFVIPPLRGDGLEVAITAPVSAVGGRLQEGVLGRLVAEAGTDVGGLPLLQHALWELWERRHGPVITFSALDRLGGVAGALADHAEDTWQALDGPQRRIARRLLLRTLVPTPDGATARPVDRRDLPEFGAAADVEAVVSALVEARLLTASGQEGGLGSSALQLSHEAVIVAWPRMRGWVEAHRAHLLVAQRLATATEAWSRQDRHADWLLAGQRLDDTLDLAAAIEAGRIDLVLSSAETRFLAASEAARVEEVRREAERQDRERDLQQAAMRRLRVGLVLSAAENALEHDPERSILLAHAVSDDVRSHTPEHQPGLNRLVHQALSNHLRIARLSGAGPLLGILGDHRLLCLANSEGNDGDLREVFETPRSIVTRDRATGALLERLPLPPQPAPPEVAFDASRNLMALGGADGRIILTDVPTWRIDRVIEGPRTPIGSLSLSPDGRLVAGLWWHDNTRHLLVHDVSTGDQVHAGDPVTQPEHVHEFEPGHQLDFHPQGHRLVVTSGSEHSRLQLLDTATWDVVADHRIRPTVTWVRHAPDGSAIGVAHLWGVSIHDADSLDCRQTLRTTAKVPAAAWLRHGKELLSVGNRLRVLAPDDSAAFRRAARTRVRPHVGGWADDRVVVRVPGSDHVITGRRTAKDLHTWNLESEQGVEIARLTGDTGNQGSVAWSPDGQLLAKNDRDGWITVWTVDTWSQRSRHRITDHVAGNRDRAHADSLTWSPDGADLMAVGSGGILVVIDVNADTPRFVRERPPRDYYIGGTDVSADNRWIVATCGALIEVLDRQGRLVASLDSPQNSSVEAVNFSPDGRLLATTHWPMGVATPGSQGATVWDWRTREIVAHLPGAANNVSFAPDGTTLAVSRDGSTAIWNLTTDEVVQELTGHHGWVQDVEHSPDGTLIATGGFDGDLRIWDAETGTQRLHLTGHPHIQRIRFHPNRPWVAMATLPGVVHVWTLDTAELLDVARSRVTRDLTSDERRRFLIGYETT